MKSLLKDISRDELLKMRESGMSNVDIANALEVSLQTIYRHIGAQGGRGGKCSRRIAPPPTFSGTEKPAKEAHEACLALKGNIFYLEGLFAKYKVDTSDQEIHYDSADDMLHGVISFDELECFVKELSAIQRKVGSLKFENEMW